MKASRKLKRNVLLILLASSLAGVVGCRENKKKKTDDTSKVNTLDNLARGDEEVNPNECSPFGGTSKKRHVVLDEENTVTFADNVSMGVRDEIRNDIHGVLANIPVGVLGVFVGLKSKIEVNTQTAKICKDLIAEGNESDASQFAEGDLLVSCWMRDELGAATIYIDPLSTVIDGGKVASGIHHGLVRSFGYVVSEMCMKNVRNVDRGLEPLGIEVFSLRYSGEDETVADFKSSDKMQSIASWRLLKSTLGDIFK